MEALDTRGAGEFLERSPAAIRNMVLRRIIPHRKVGGRLVFIREELEEFVRRSPGVTSMISGMNEMAFEECGSRKARKWMEVFV